MVKTNTEAVIEIEGGDEFTFVYVPRTKANMSLIRKLTAIKNPMADYWNSWNQYTETYFTSDWNTYNKNNCVAHSWTFNTPLLMERVKKLVGNLPFVDKTKQYNTFNTLKTA